MRIFLFIVSFLVATYGFSQNDLLAKNYLEQGQYEKALSIYKTLIKESPGRLDYLLAMVEANQQLEKFSDAEVLLREQTIGNRVNPQLFVELGYNFSLQNKDAEASQEFEKATQRVLDNTNYAYSVGAAFEKYSLLEEAVSMYEKVMVADSEKDFNPQIARIYGEQGKLEKMFNSYLNMIEKNPSFTPAAQRNFSLYVSEDATNEANILLRKALLQRSQNSPDLVYNQLLSWLFIQQKEFKKAFIQEKAIYKRNEEGLQGISDLALIALSEKEYASAREIIQFVIDNSTTPESKLQGNQYLMKIALETATPKQYPELEKQFEALFTQFGNGPETYLLQIDYNHFLAFSVGKMEAAIQNLKQMLSNKMTPYQEARVKMELADILVFDEKFNEALIYYSQIQKKVQSDVLAQEARFKVAKTSYYKTDFEWAQIQLDVLKKSTSQLIANDAMQLSLMIRDNSLEDSTQVALKKYARADLLAFQNKIPEAIAVLEDILTNHKGEKIEDEALLKQGEIYGAIGEFSKAEANYLKIISLFKDDILADDAHYRLAKLYEEKLQQPEKAKDQYELIIFNFENSIYFIEARKKFRMLRGDAIN